MARRGEKLREHILWTAKDLFLASGYERTSMDLVAARAETSKRSLYAHFPSKDALYAGVADLVRELYLERLGEPEERAGDRAEAVVRYCGRLLQLLLWISSLRSLRLGITEAERLPETAAAYHDAIFEVPTTRLAGYLARRWDLDDAAAAETARVLLGRAVFPELLRGLLGVRVPITERPEEATLADDIDLGALRDLVRALLPG